jgi:hypothetical protein
MRLGPARIRLSNHLRQPNLRPSLAKMSELATLSLFPATPDQVIASRKRTFVEWAKGMTLEQYLQRDASLDAMEHAVNGNLTTW